MTVLIPVRNEERDLGRCLSAVLVQDYPHDHLEVVVVDGRSTDRTVEIATTALGRSDIEWRLVDNPTATTPSNLNAGLAEATGEYICRVDARSVIPSDYVRRCVETLVSREAVAVTGGAQRALARRGTAKSRGIARALNNRYTMGGSRYRLLAASGESDTVYLGAFRTAQLRDAGGWDEFFETNQDFELNRRLGRTGLVWFDADIVVGYLPRESLLALWRQYERFGRWKMRYWRRSGDLPRPRQAFLLLGAGVLTAFIVVAAVRRRKTLVFVPLLPLVLDAAGSHGEARLPVRAWSSSAITVVCSAWVFGLVREMLRGDRSGNRGRNR